MFIKNYKSHFFILLMLLFNSDRVGAQNHNAALNAADSSGFSINSNGGWQLFNSYVAAYKTDSVVLELIVQNTNNINWTKEQYIGKIKKAEFIPQTEQKVYYSLVVTVYNVWIDTEGKCYLRVVSGILPQQKPAVIPIKIFYKK